LHDEVVDAHRDQVDADRVVTSGGDRDLELGADAVGGGDQDRIPVARRLEVEERAEAAEPGRGARPRRRSGERLDRLDQGIASCDVDAGVAVILALYGALDRYRLLPRHRTRRRDNTVDAEGFAMPLRRWLAIAGLVLLASGAALSLARAAEPRFDLFTVTAVALDATAANATAARDQAIADGQQRALRMLLERLTLVGDRDRLPKVGVAQMNELLQGFEVAHERRSGVRYLAEYTFHFRPDPVRQLLRQAGIAFAETPSKPLLVLPVLHDGDRVVLWDDPNPWRDAWSAALIPAGLVRAVQPYGELDDIASIDAEAAVRGDGDKLQAISQRYGAADVLVSQATLKTDGVHSIDVTTTRYVAGEPGREQTWVTTTAPGPGESDAELMQHAASGAFAQVAEAWKAANILDFSQSGTLLARVPASSLQDWLAVRDRLGGIPAVRSSKLVSLDREGARVEIRYVGDAAQLRLAMAQRDLDLSGSEPDWVLQRRSTAAPR
jgi:hypothetical protein